jgi:mannose-1-phosphate guanylyltransferase
MRAILLAAGLGTRLKPLTNIIPKCLVPIKGQELLGFWLDRLSKAGIGPFLINTHHLSEQVQAYIENSPYCDKVTLAHENELLGTAGTVISNLDFLGGHDGLLIHADNYCMADLKSFLLAHKHRPSGCLMTMMTFRSDTPASCGIVELDERGVVVGFHEKVENPPSNLANGAVYLLSRELLKLLATELSAAVDFSTEVLPQLVGRIYTYETKEYFLDIGTPEAYHKANFD